MHRQTEMRRTLYVFLYGKSTMLALSLGQMASLPLGWRWGRGAGQFWRLGCGLEPPFIGRDDPDMIRTCTL